MNLDTLVHDAVVQFLAQDKEPVLCNSALEHLEMLYIIPESKRECILREFKHTPPPTDSSFEQKPWHYPVHMKFLKIYKDRSIDTLLKVNTLNYFMKFYAFLQVNCDGWTHDTGGECNYLISDYMGLVCRDMNRIAQDRNTYLDTLPKILEPNKEPNGKRIDFLEMISADIDRNDKERYAKSLGFENHPAYRKHLMDEWIKESELEQDNKKE